MTKTEKTELTHEVFEKAWHASKKFLAFLLVDSMLAAMAIVALIKQDEIGWPLSAFMVGIVFVMGFVAVSFNSRQADVDKFVRMAALNYKQPDPNQLPSDIQPPKGGTAAIPPQE
jgi:hypothetical protein